MEARFDELMSDSLPSAAAPSPLPATAVTTRVRPPNGAVTACCTIRGAEIVLSFGAADVIERLRRKLEKALGKKGLNLAWTDELDSPDVVIRFLRIDEGSQLLRYLMPFLGPAVLEVEGQAAIDGSGPRRFHYTQKAQFGIFGGSAKGMLNVCADRVAGKIAKEILKASRK
jgi:hypothetical protein